MTAIKTKAVGFRQDGKQLIQAFILSDTTVIYVLANATIKTYIANESGVFVGQKQQGGSGGGSTVSLDDVVALIADFSDDTSYTILNGAYYGTKRAIVS